MRGNIRVSASRTASTEGRSLEANDPISADRIHERLCAEGAWLDDAGEPTGHRGLVFQQVGEKPPAVVHGRRDPIVLFARAGEQCQAGAILRTVVVSNALVRAEAYVSRRKSCGPRPVLNCDDRFAELHISSSWPSCLRQRSRRQRPQTSGFRHHDSAVPGRDDIGQATYVG